MRKKNWRITNKTASISHENIYFLLTKLEDRSEVSQKRNSGHFRRTRGDMFLMTQATQIEVYKTNLFNVNLVEYNQDFMNDL